MVNYHTPLHGRNAGHHSSKSSCAAFKFDIEANGVWPELEAAAEQVITGVIPRLLGILQSDGRELKPSLIHGDCWEGDYTTLSGQWSS